MGSYPALQFFIVEHGAKAEITFDAFALEFEATLRASDGGLIADGSGDTLEEALENCEANAWDVQREAEAERDERRRRERVSRAVREGTEVRLDDLPPGATFEHDGVLHTVDADPRWPSQSLIEAQGRRVNVRCTFAPEGVHVWLSSQMRVTPLSVRYAESA